MISKHGAPLISTAAQYALKHHLIPLASIVTPNIPEAELLCGMAIRSEKDMVAAGGILLDLVVRP